MRGCLLLLCFRPTIFIEIIERRGCLKESAPQAGSAAAAAAEPTAAGGDADAGGAASAVADKFKDIVQVGVERDYVLSATAACKQAIEHIAC